MNKKINESIISTIIRMFSKIGFVNFIAIIIAVVLFLPKVKAHVVSYDKWILINNEWLLITNPSPYTGLLESAEHTFSKNFLKNSPLELKVDTTTIKGFDPQDITVEWVLGTTKYVQNPLNYTFKNDGSYFFEVILKQQSTDEVITKDKILIQIGESNINPKVFANNQLITEKLLNISQDTTLSIDNQNFNKVEWLYKSLKSSENNLKIEYSKVPQEGEYVVLRIYKDNYFYDWYLRVSPINNNYDSNIQVYLLIIIGIGIVSIASLLFYVRKHK